MTLGMRAPLVRRVLTYVRRGPRGLPDGLSVEWQLVPARWLGIGVVALVLPWLQFPPAEQTAALLLLGFAALFNLAVQCALHRRPGLLASGYVTALGDTLLSLAMVYLAGGAESPMSAVFAVVGVSIALRASFGPALAMALLVTAAGTLATGRPPAHWSSEVCSCASR
jgi:hypothetical protein